MVASRHLMSDVLFHLGMETLHVICKSSRKPHKFISPHTTWIKYRRGSWD